VKRRSAKAKYYINKYLDELKNWTQTKYMSTNERITSVYAGAQDTYNGV